MNWNEFEKDDTKEFVEIPIEYSTLPKLPTGTQSGTTLIIEELREEWDRESLLKLKRSLMKLISPNVSYGELPFVIRINAPSEQKEDDNLLIKMKEGRSDTKEKSVERQIVNGPVKNDVFEKLNIKTTNIEVSVSQDGESITSKLSDRGEFIYSLEERNQEYKLLRDVGISVSYLNQSAKNNFTRQMGIAAVNYGSIFVYKNGFRIYPYGEPNQDFFNIDQRKAQGYNRYLGTREIIGRISVGKGNDQLIETSSRAHGFISTPAVDMLNKFFLEKVLRVLEKYTVSMINWGEPLKNDPSHTIQPEEIGARIVSYFDSLRRMIVINNEKGSVETSSSFMNHGWNITGIAAHDFHITNIGKPYLIVDIRFPSQGNAKRF
jgi:hypothetical protein